MYEVRVASKASHLVAAVRSEQSIIDHPICTEIARLSAPDAERENKSTSPWYLFNDFVVENISEEEALGVPSSWKVRPRPRAAASGR